MKNKLFICIAGLAFCAAAFMGCSSDDIQGNGDGGQESLKPALPPLTITVGGEDKSSRVAVNDGNGDGQEDGITKSISLTWEDGDELVAYSPDYENTDGTNGAYTTLVLKSGAGTAKATFVEKTSGSSKYVPGKPLYIYYHGGETSTSNGQALSAERANGAIATFERPYDGTSSTTASSDLFMIGKDADKSVKENPYFVRSGFVASAPEDGALPDVALEGRMALLSFRLPYGIANGLVGGISNLLGTITYDVKIACKRSDTGAFGFPSKIALNANTDGTLSETVESWGDPVTYHIEERGLLNPTGPSLWKGNGMVYVCIPAIKYENLRIEVKLAHLNANSLVTGFLLGSNAGILNQTFTWPANSKTNGGMNFTINPNNNSGNIANKVYGLGDVMTVVDTKPSGRLGAIVGTLVGTLGVYQNPGEQWTLMDASIIDL